MKHPLSSLRWLLLLAVVALSLQCGKGDLSLPDQQDPAVIGISGGDTQIGEVGQPLATDLTVRVLDSKDRPVKDAKVKFTLGAGDTGSDVIPDTAITDDDGVAHARWVLGQSAGAKTVEARVVGNGVPGGLVTTFHATAMAAPASKIVMLKGDQQSGQVGTQLFDSLVVRVTDVFDNPVAGITVDWIAIGGGSVSGASVVTNAKGEAGVLRVLGNAAGQQGAEATAAGLTGSPVVFVHTAVAGIANTLTKDPATDGQFGLVGLQLADSLVVFVKDASGNGVPGRNVLWTIGSGSGSITPTTSVTDANGEAFARWTLGPNAGNQTVNAAVATLTPVTFTATAVAAQPDTIFHLTATTQNGTAGGNVAAPPSVRVTDANHNPVRGVIVTFTVTAGGGTLSDGTTSGTTTTIATDATGSATLASWTLGAVAGANSIAASATDPTSLPLKGSPVFFDATGQAGPATRLVVSTQPSAAAQSGIVLGTQPAVQLQDANGNPVSQSGRQVTVSVTGGGATLSGGLLTIGTNATGAATFSGLMLSGPVGPYTLTFSATNLTSAISNTITLSAGLAANLAIATQPSSSAASGVPFAPQPAIQVTDGAGNPVSGAGVPVTAAIFSGGGTLGGTATANTDPNGLATFTDLAITGTPGARVLNFTSGTLTAVRSQSVTLGAGSAAQLAITTQPSTAAQSGSVLARQPVIQLQDASGTPVAQQGVNVHAAVSTGGILAGTVDVATDVNGVATFSGLSIAGPAGNYTLDFSAAGPPVLTGVTSNAVAISAGQGTTLTITAQPSAAAQSGVPFPQQPVIQLRDDALNPVHQAGVPITAAILTGPGGVLSTATVTVQTNANGVAIFASLKLSGALGDYTLQFTGPSQPAVVSNTVTLAAGPAAVLVVVTQPSATAQNTLPFAQQPVVHIEDGTGNPVAQAGTTVSATIGAGGSGVLGGTKVLNTDAAGLATFTDLFITGTVGPRVLNFTATGLTSVLSTSIDLSAGPAATLAKNAGDNQSATAGSPVAISPSAKVTDVSGNPVAGVTVTFVVATGGGSAGGTTPLSDINGLATVGGWTLGVVAGTNTLTADVPGLGGSPVTFTATGAAGGAGSLAMVTQPSTTAQSGVAFAIQPAVRLKDQNGNNVLLPGVAVTASASAGTLNGNTTVTTGPQGVATFGSLSITGAIGNYTLTFSAASLTGVTSNSITLSAGAANKLVVTTQPSDTAQSAIAFPQQPVITVQDLAGNPVNVTRNITATISSGGGTLGGTTSLNTSGGSGVTFTDLTITGTVGPRVLLFSTGGLASDNSTSIELIAGAPSQMTAVTPLTQSATVGTAVPNPPSVRVRDVSGNPIAGVTITFAIGSGGGSINGPVQVTDLTGVATVSDWTVGSVAGSNTLTATATGSGISGNPLTFTATGTSGTAANIALNAGNGQSATAGTAVATDPSVLVTDANGNGVQGVAVTFAVTGGGGSVLPVAAVPTNSSGIATATSWTLGTVAGTNTLTATAAGLSGSPVPFTATATAGAPSAAQTTATVPGGTAGQPTTISIVSRDQFGNARTSGGATVVVNVSGANTASPAVTDNADGTYSAVYTPVSAGSDNVAITLNGGAIGGSPYTSVVAAAGATKLAFLVQPGTEVAGVAIAPVLQVAVQDVNGNTVTSSTATVGIAIGNNPGGSTLSGTTSVAAVNGVATFPGLSLNHSGTLYSLVASSTSLTSATSLSFTVNPAGANQLSITTQPSANAQSGVLLGTQPVIQLRDQFGNAVSQANVNVTVTASGGTLGGTTGVNTNASGVATFAGLSLTGPVGSYTLTFQATSLNPATSSTITLAAGSAVSIAKNGGDNQSAPAGSAVAVAPSAIALDGAGNPVSGVNVTFAVASGGGTVVPTTAVTTNQFGIAAVTSWTLGNTAGSNTLTATSGTLSGSPLAFTATGTTGSATQVVITTVPSASVQSGVAFPVQPVVQLRDGLGNNVAQAGVSITAGIASGGGTLNGNATVVTSGTGQAAFTGVSISGIVGTRTLSFTSTGLSSATSGNIVVGAGPATTIAVSAGDNQSAAVGTAVAVDPAVLVTDASGNGVQNVNVTFAVASGGGTVVPTTAIATNGSGIATVTSWTLGPLAGANSLTATSGTLGGSPVTFHATAGAGGATKIAFTVQPTSIVAGAAISPSVQVTVQDAGGNTVTTATDLITIAIGNNPGSSTLSGTASVNAVAGVATFPGLSLNHTGNGYTLTAAATGLTSATSSGFNVTPGTAASLLFTTQPSNAVAGSFIAPAVQVAVKDAQGNTVTGASTSIAIAIGNNAGGGTLSGTATRNAVSGIATFTDLSINAAAAGYTLTADGGGLPQATSSAFTIQVGTGNRLDFTVQPSSTTVGASITPSIQVAVKDGSGNIVTGATDQITLVIANNPGGAALQGTTVQNAVNGVASFSGISLSRSGNGYTLSALASGLVSTTSSAFNIGVASSTTAINNDTPDPSRVGQSYNVTFTVASGGGTPTGTVTVSDGLDSCNGALAGGSGSCQLTSSTAGAKTLVATYAGDGNFTGSTSAGAGHAVNAAITTTAFSSDLPDPSVAGEPVTIDWAVSVSAPGGGTPTGNVTITVNDASGATCSAPVTAGTCQMTLPLAGAKTLTATYAGDGNYGPSSDTEAHGVGKATTTVAITGDTPDPSAVGQAVSVTYAVAVSAPGGGAPTGNVTVSDGTGATCVGTAGAGGCTLTPTTAGAKNLVATYAGDANYNTSTSSSVTHSVGTATTATAITNDAPDPSTVGQAYAVSYTVTSAGGTPTGNVTVSDGSGATCVGTVAAGTCNITSTSVGNPKTLTATYAGDANFQGSASAGVAHVVNVASSTTTITADTPEPSTVGAAVSVTVTVTSTGGTPTGTVDLDDGTGATCTITLASGSGSCNLTPTSAGAKTLTATYNGSTNFSGSADTEPHTVNAAATTTTITNDTPDPSAVGQAYTVTFTVTSGGGTPTGNVTVSDGAGATCIGTVAVGNCAITSTAGGAKNLTASYAGSANFAASTSTAVAHGVNAAATTTTITSDNPDPSTVGAAIAVNVTVASTGGTPTGTVDVDDGTGATCSITLSGGQGSCNLVPTTAGAKTITADYTANANFAGSTDTDAHTVNAAATATSITNDAPDPSTVGQAYTVSFTVTSGGGTPSGNVTVADGTGATCVGTVAAGSCAITSTTSGAKTLVATYAGNANFSTSTSAGVAHSVNIATTTTTITNDTPDPSAVGQAYTVSYTVTSGGGTPTGNVTVADGAGATCVGTVAAGSCAITSTAAGAKTLVATYAGDANFGGSASVGAAHGVNAASTTTTITGDAPDPSAVGAAIAVNVTVASTGGTPTGTVDVDDGTGATCTVTLSGGAGSCNLTPTTAGAKTITADYNATTNFAGSTDTEPHSVGLAATTTTITNDTPDPSTVGQAYTVSYTVTSGGGTPSGNVTVADGAGATCVGTVAAGSCAITSTTAGGKTLTATYAGNANFATSASVGVAHGVNTASTTTAITSDTPDPSTFGSAYTVNYSVSVTAPGAGTPTGNVTVSDGTGGSCTATAAAGTCNISNSSAGAKTLVATYAGDANFVTSTSGGAAHTVNQAATTTTITSDNPDPSAVGAAISVNVTVASTGGTPGGSVNVDDGTGDTCVITLSGGAGSCNLVATTSGAKTITATYPATGNFAGSSDANAHSVGTATTTTTITNDTPDPTVVGQSYTVSFTVTSGGGTPSGNVTVADGAGATCVGTVAAGSCAITSTTAGAKTLVATYAGNANFGGSASVGTAHGVNQSATTTAITSDTPDPSTFGSAYTVNYTVSITAPGAGSPTGNVTVADGAGGSCTATAAAGTCNISNSSAGAKTLTATYAGDANFVGSASAGAAHTVNQAATTTTITSDNPDPSAVGAAIAVNVTVASAAGTPTGSVNVDDGTGDTCVITLSGGTGSCNLTATTSGAKTITATYPATGNFLGSSDADAHSVGTASTTTTITNDTPDPSTVGQAYTVSFTVTSTGGTPGGNVTVADGTGATCVGTVAAGSCAITSTTAGAKTLVASYAGNANFGASASTGAAHGVNAASTTTTITSDSPDPSAVGAAISVNVTVASTGGTPTGTVDVDDGTGATCTVTLSGGSGSCNLVPTTSGAKTISASYNATTNFVGSSDNEPHTVSAASTTTAITNDTPDPSTVGQAYTVSYTVTSGGGTPSGNVTVADGTGATCVGTVAAGSCAITSTTVGAKTLVATYAGNANFGGSASVGTAHGVNQASTTTAITSDTPDPSTFGSAYTVNYSVSVTAPGAGSPTGNVTVADGTGGSCTATAAAGTCNISNSSAGAKSLVATYAGDANFGGSASAGTPHTVNQAATTTTITSDNPDPSAVGAAIAVNVTVASTGGTPGGSVNVDDGTGDTCVITLSGGSGSCNLVATTSGAKTITATYPATGNFLGSSATDAHSVGVASTTTSIASDTPDPTVVGQSYTVSYTVTSGGGTPAGNVTVSDGAGQSCVGTVAAGQCVITSVATGAKTLTADYPGNANFGPSTSAGTPHGVNQAATTTAITSDTPDPSTFGSAYAVNYTVSVTAPGTGTPTGNVTVVDGTGGSCTATVAAGTCSIANSSVGAKTLVATYAGDVNFSTSASAGTSHTVNQASSTTTITSDNPDPSAVGAAIAVNVTVASGGGTPTGSVNVDDGTGDTCVITLSGGAGSCNLVPTTAGAKTITATYPATTNFLGSNDTEPHQVNVATSTTTITGQTAPPTVIGQSITVNFSVTSAFTTPTGTVTVSDGTDGCSASVATGSCSFTPTTSGNKTITASYPGDATHGPSSGNVAHQVNAFGAADHLSFVVQPTNTQAGTDMSPGPEVAVLDAFDNLVTNSNDVITIAIDNDPNGGSSLLSGSTQIGAANGVAAFTDLQIDLTGSNFTFKASASGLTGAGSTQFDITP